jgi:hypothetical protein
MTVANTFPTLTAPVSHANPVTSDPVAQGPPGVSSYVNNRGQPYRVSVNTANVLAIVQPIAMIVNVHPVMRVTLFLLLAPVLLHHLLMLLL